MVVSCQKKLIIIFLFLFLFLPVVHADVTILSDQELDQIYAGESLFLPNDISLPEGVFETGFNLNSLSELASSLFDDQLWTSQGLINISAENSEVMVQTNISIIQNSQLTNVYLSNTFNSQ